MWCEGLQNTSWCLQILSIGCCTMSSHQVYQTWWIKSGTFFRSKSQQDRVLCLGSHKAESEVLTKSHWWSSTLIIFENPCPARLADVYTKEMWTWGLPQSCLIIILCKDCWSAERKQHSKHSLIQAQWGLRQYLSNLPNVSEIELWTCK